MSLPRLSALTLIVAHIAACSQSGAARDPSPAQDGHPAGYQLVFRDEFDGPQLDRRLWCTRYPYSGGAPLQRPDPDCGRDGRGTLDFLGVGSANPEQQRYVDTNARGEPLHRIERGVLSLRATKTRNDAAAPYESAMIRSKREFRPTATTSYYITARVRLPQMRGSWPAFWLTPGIGPDGQTGWPPEIDILEAPLNDKWDTADMLTLTTQAQNWGGEGVKGATTLLYAHPDYDGDARKWHAPRNMRLRWIEAGLEWTQQQACFFIDGTKIACMSYEWKHNDGRLAPAATVVLNLAIGGWAGRNGIDDGAMPVSFDVDHVRVYRKSEAAPP